MRFTTTHRKITRHFLFMGALLMMVSCGSYQYVGYDNDGIYSSGEVVTQAEQAANSRSNSKYYENFFAQEAENAQEVLGESDVFTDIDSYSSGNVAVEDVEIIEGNYGGWGQVNDQVTINYYNNGWNNFGWGFNDPWLWNGGFGWNNWGWGGFGWNRWNRWGGFGLGWNNWGWGGGFGWHGGLGWNNWGWNNGYYRNDLAFHRGRRGNGLRRSLASVDRRNSISRRNAFSNRRNATINRNGRTIARRSNNTSVRRRTSGTSVRNRGSQSSRIRGGSATRSSRANRSSTSRRSSNGNVRRGSSSRGSSGSVRRSSGSSRSSGSVRSGSSRSSSGSRSSSRGGSRGGRRG